MKEEDFKKQQEEGKVEVVRPKPQEKKPEGGVSQAEMYELAYILEGLKVTHKPIASAPVFTPRNFSEQIQLYENGGTVRLYIYVNQTWRYVALT